MTTFDSRGASIDSYADTRQKIATKVLAVLGADMKVDDEDSVVGKIVTIAAIVADETNQKLQHAVAVRDPDSSSGTGLAKLVKLNGITKNAAAYSTVAVTVGSNAYGATIEVGDQVYDPENPDILWALDSGTVLAPRSTATISATCETPGAIPALPDTLTSIKTPRQGWSTVTNESAASLGAIAESDPALRRRRERVARSYGKSTLYGVWAALEDYDEVSDVYVHQNLLNENDEFGVPPRNMQAFVRGGDDAIIAEILFRTAPLQTFGTSSASYNHRGHDYTTYFSRPTDTAITVQIGMSATSRINPPAFPSWASAAIKTALISFVAENQLMGVDAIPEQMAAAIAGIVPGYYAKVATINSASAVVEADMGEAFTLDRDDITVNLI